MNRKKILLILILFSISISNTKALNTCLIFRQIITDSINLKAQNLKRLYVLSTASSADSIIYQHQFFDAFPDNFKELNKLYGYDDHKASPLYYDAIKHIYELFNNLKSINDTLYYKKIISIALNGHWDADAISYFQFGLRNKVLANPDLAVYTLQNLSENDILSFWYFYFDDIHPKKQIPESLLKIKSINNMIYDLMIKAQIDVFKHPK